VVVNELVRSASTTPLRSKRPSEARDPAPGGCVCCEVRADLAEALLRLERSVAHGESQRFERVIVETSGLAEPAPILQLFAESPLLAGRYRLDAL